MAKTARDLAYQVLEVHRDPQVREAAKSLRETDMKKIQVLGLVQEALQQLRLDVKYLAFDLEATRRERDEYKAQLGK